MTAAQPPTEPCPRNPRYTAEVERHVRRPVGAGRLSAPTVTGEAGSRRCGDLVRIELRVDGGRIIDAGFQAYGCPAAIAGGSAVVERIQGGPVLAAASLGEEEVARALGFAGADDRSCPGLAVEALHAALQNLVGRREVPLVPQAGDPDLSGGTGLSPDANLSHDRGHRPGVVLGMSGGVDSSAAALLLRDAGYEVVGVTFRLWSDPSCGLDNACCSPEAVREARRLAHRLGLPHFMVDLSEDFYREVVEYFVEEYRGARTPNPCVRCNASVRFAELAALADRLGFAHIATGHYARVGPAPHGAGPAGGADARTAELRRARDEQKDQSYVLAQVAPELLDRLLLPLGELHKEEVRGIAREAGIAAHDRPESQDICFVPDDDYRRFLRDRLGELPGPIVDMGGRVLGSHDGLYNYTVGQRRGLGVAVGAPLYVAGMRPDDRALVVGPGESAEVDRIVVAGVLRHRPELPGRVEAQLRSSGHVTPADVRENADGGLELTLARRIRGVAPGQQAVLYAGDVVVAAGTIVEATADAA